MARDPHIKPFLKWAGGKRSLLPAIKHYWPQTFDATHHTYFEPFLGGRAVLLTMQPRRAIVNDVNGELINCYQVVRDAVEDLIACLKTYRNDEAYYYALRDWDRASDFHARPAVERAARIIFLNKTCYNGLFRVNQRGQFNVPFGRYAEPLITDVAVLRAVSAYLSDADVRFLQTDFAEAVCAAGAGDFVYCDPPYDFEPGVVAFTSYAKQGFAIAEQQRLKAVVDDLDQRGCRFMLSNAATARAIALYSAYHVAHVEAPRPINSDATRRGIVQEILVRNYGEAGD